MPVYGSELEEFSNGLTAIHNAWNDREFQRKTKFYAKRAKDLAVAAKELATGGGEEQRGVELGMGTLPAGELVSKASSLAGDYAARKFGYEGADEAIAGAKSFVYDAGNTLGEAALARGSQIVSNVGDAAAQGARSAFGRLTGAEQVNVGTAESGVSEMTGIGAGDDGASAVTGVVGDDGNVTVWGEDAPTVWGGTDAPTVWSAAQGAPEGASLGQNAYYGLNTDEAIARATAGKGTMAAAPEADAGLGEALSSDATTIVSPAGGTAAAGGAAAPEAAALEEGGAAALEEGATDAAVAGVTEGAADIAASNWWNPFGWLAAAAAAAGAVYSAVEGSKDTSTGETEESGANAEAPPPPPPDNYEGHYIAPVQSNL